MYALAERGHGRANLDRHQESRKTVEEYSLRTFGAFACNTADPMQPLRPEREFTERISDPGAKRTKRGDR